MTDHDLQPDVLQLICERGQRGLSLRQLVEHRVAETGDGRSTTRSQLRPVLKRLVADGAVVLGRGKRYFAAEATDLVVGTIRMTASGVAVVTPRDGDQQPIRIEKAGLRGALDGDLVQIRLERARRRARAEGQREGVVAAILERARRTVVGRWSGGERGAEVHPVDRRVGVTVRVTGLEVAGEPAEGEFVEVTLDEVSRSGRARGRVVERLGRPGDAGVEDRVVLRMFSLNEAFPPEVVAEVEALAAGIDAVDSAELTERWDLRDRPAVTIDPVTARDFDDAVSAEPGRDGSIAVEVHIADVGAFVRPGSAVDREARDRSTSVYLPGRVVPMLPEHLSADLCSLRPDEDRRAFTVRFEVRSDGSFGRCSAQPSLIRSRRRLSYGEVAVWLDSGSWPDPADPVSRSLQLCGDAAQRLSARRRAQGSLDFDFAEPELTLDDAGRVVAVTPVPRTSAHRLVEELMVAANRVVAEMILEAGRGALHRVHDRPDPRRLADLAATLAELGVAVTWEADTVTARHLQQVLDRAAGLPTERFISTLVLRSLARAVYSPEARGHFALAAEAYLHFTSPIRRYPDLVAHRVLRSLVEKRPGTAEVADEAALRVLGEHCTAREQRAEAAERMAVQWRVVVFLADRVGERFAGRITGVTDFGLFVELERFAVDGLVHVSDLDDDFYHHDPVSHTLVGERGGSRYRLGDRVEVRLVRADTTTLQVQLALVGVRPDGHERLRLPSARRPPGRAAGDRPRRGRGGGGRRRR